MDTQRRNPTINISPDGRIENERAVPYDFSIPAILNEAWQKVSGFKGTLWGGILIYLLSAIFLFILSWVITFTTMLFSDPSAKFVGHALGVIRFLLLYPMSVGLVLLGVKRMANRPTQSNMVLNYYNDIVRIDSVFILWYLITLVVSAIGSFFIGLAFNHDIMDLLRFLSFLAGIGFCLFGIYLLVGYMFSPYLRADKKLGILSSLRVSRRAVSQHWFKIFFLFLIVIVIVFISAIPFLIGLIWSLPWAYCVTGALYRTMFGTN
jgi:hypothetical protein